MGTTVLLAESALIWTVASRVPAAPWFLWAVPWGLLGLLAGCALLTIRGYSLESGSLVVERLLWTTRVPLTGITEVVEAPGALRITLKGFGNGGLFAILGWRHVTGYGWCRVFATDPKRTVVLAGQGRAVIVTPDRPRDFVREAAQWLAIGATTPRSTA